MTPATWIAIASVMVALLSVAAVIWRTRIDHDLAEHTNDLRRYEQLQKDVELARGDAKEARAENDALRARVAALELKYDADTKELRRVIDARDREIQRVSESRDNELVALNARIVRQSIRIEDLERMNGHGQARP